jgi:hypothetical protein
MKAKKLLKVIKPFVSDTMQVYLTDLPDNTPVRLEVSGRNGYLLQLTLEDLRNLWEAYNQEINNV